MTLTLLAPDGVPVTAQQERQARAAAYGGGSGRQLGGRSGFRPGTPADTLTATSTTWTLKPCSAMIDPGASTHQGMYGWATDANITGSVTAADATNPRKDIVYVTVNDSTAGDGSGTVSATPAYLAGTPGVTPAAPALPARSFLLGTIDVPKVGGGSPSVTVNPARFAAAGGILPISSKAERDALTPYDGLTVDRLDLDRYERYNGTAWRVAAATRLGRSRQATNSLAKAAYETRCTITAESTGGPVDVSYSGVLFNQNSGALRGVDVRILRDGLQVHETTYHPPYVAGANPGTGIGFEFDASASAGTRTWELQVRCPSSAAAVMVQELTLTLTEQPA